MTDVPFSRPAPPYPPDTPCLAFADTRCIAAGPLLKVAGEAKGYLQRSPHAAVLVFHAENAHQLEIDFRGTVADVCRRLADQEPGLTPPGVPAVKEKRGPGRPKLGVVAREITLLPRHWDWLNEQPGGASVALRKLVEEARRQNRAKDLIRQAQEAAYRFMSVMGGNLPGYEDALRSLYRGDYAEVGTLIDAWPKDIRTHTLRLVERLREAEAQA